MYLVSIIPYLFLIRFNKEEIYGINKSIGWALDISNFRYYITHIIIGFFIGFCFLALLKAKTNWFLSILFFLLLSFCSLMHDGSSNIRLIDYALMSSILVFMLLFIQSIFLKIKTKKSIRCKNKKTFLKI